MLEYLYTGCYGDAGNGPTDISSILLDVYMFAIADKYFIKPLKEKAAEKFAAHCESEWNAPEFAKATEEVYETASQDEALKDIVVATAKEHSKALFDKRDNFNEFYKVLRSVPSFSADILGGLEISDGGHKKIEELDLGTTAKFKWMFKCQSLGCDSNFTLSIPLGVDITISCPLGHDRNSFSWWKSYGKHLNKP